MPGPVSQSQKPSFWTLLERDLPPLPEEKKPPQPNPEFEEELYFPLQNHLNQIHQQDEALSLTRSSLSPFPKPYQASHENASSLDKIHNRLHLQEKPLTETFFKTLDPGCIPTDMKKLSGDEISKVNERFQSASIVPEVEVQRFCFSRFLKVIPTNYLCKPESPLCRQLVFNPLRTGLRTINEATIQKIKQVKLSSLRYIQVSKPIQDHIKLIRQQERARKQKISLKSQ